MVRHAPRGSDRDGSPSLALISPTIAAAAASGGMAGLVRPSLISLAHVKSASTHHPSRVARTMVDSISRGGSPGPAGNVVVVVLLGSTVQPASLSARSACAGERSKEIG